MTALKEEGIREVELQNIPSSPGAAPNPSGWSNGGTVNLRVSKRLLWIGDAVYPLRNIVRVQTCSLKPKRAEAGLIFAKRIGIVAAVVLGAITIDIATHILGGGGTLSASAFLLGLVAATASLADMVRIVSASEYHVLSVETGGPSSAVVTCANEEVLRRLVEYITDAIDNPDGDGLAATMSRYLVDRIAGLSNVEVVTQVQITALEGRNGTLEAIRWRHQGSGEEDERPVRHLTDCRSECGERRAHGVVR